MSLTIQIILLAAVGGYFFILWRLLGKKQLTLKYTLLWILIGVILLILALFPQILSFISNLLGFQENMNALYLCLIGFVYILLVSLTAIDSKQSEDIKNLVQENAMLEKRVRDLENMLREERDIG